MTMPVYRIEYGSVEPLPEDEAFTLDSSTIGILNTNRLSGGNWIIYRDLNAQIRSITINRGRSKQLDRFISGTANIVLNNSDRIFDPSNFDSPYYSLIAPRLRIKIFADDIQIYAGFVTDWDISYDISYQDIVSLTLADSFTIISNYIFDEDTAPEGLFPGQRIDWLLNYFEFEDERNLETGNITLVSDDISKNRQALDYIFSVASSDRAFFFADSSNKLQYFGRFSRLPVSIETFSDDGIGIPYRTLTTEFGDELLYNRISATSPAGTETVENTDSMANYGISVLNFTGLLNESSADLLLMVEEYLEKFAFPNLQFSGCSVELAGLSSALREDILNLELADQVTLERTFLTGNPLTLSQDLMISGINHRIGFESHIINFRFETTPYKDGFKLDDDVRGILDSSDYFI